jgi:hypothetical protein
MTNNFQRAAVDQASSQLQHKSTPTDQTSQENSPNNLKRPGRSIRYRQSNDTNIITSYGQDVRIKEVNAVRFFFQNVKGLTYSSSGEDYEYYFQNLKNLQVDVAGMAETNTPWQLNHIKTDFLMRAKKHHQITKTVFGSVNVKVDPVHTSEKYQAGGCLTMVQGIWTTAVQRDEINDPSGLGRWAGFTISGKNQSAISIISA